MLVLEHVSNLQTDFILAKMFYNQNSKQFLDL